MKITFNYTQWRDILETVITICFIIIMIYMQIVNSQIMVNVRINRASSEFPLLGTYLILCFIYGIIKLTAGIIMGIIYYIHKLYIYCKKKFKK